MHVVFLWEVQPSISTKWVYELQNNLKLESNSRNKTKMNVFIIGKCEIITFDRNGVFPRLCFQMHSQTSVSFSLWPRKWKVKVDFQRDPSNKSSSFCDLSLANCFRIRHLKMDIRPHNGKHVTASKMIAIEMRTGS